MNVTLYRPRSEEIVHVSYEGGRLADLAFGYRKIGVYRPCETMDVGDLEDLWAGHEGELEARIALLKAAVTEWMDTQDQENPGWYSQYLANCP